MIVSQYMYTACGKMKKGDFSVWAKSPDITDAEGEEIHQMMVCKNPVGVNLYNATEEEMRKACPTRYAYFILSTGKKVFAESNFIGRVYSNLDGRWGNFFIHAYVFDKLDGVMPMSVLGNGLFKGKLEYAEWHDEPCPETLPQKDLQPAAVDFRAVESFLTPERKEKLLPLLQAAINAANGGETVSFNDTEDNQKLWYTAIGMLLTEAEREKVTFATQVTPTFQAAVPVGGITSAKPLAMRNIAEGTPPTVFNYNASVQQGKPAFDFRTNALGKIAVSKYVYALGVALEKGLMSALEYVRDIQSLSNTYGCDCETAVDLYMLKCGNISWFKDLAGYCSVVTSAEKFGMITEQAGAELLYKAVFTDAVYTPALVDISLLKKIYGLLPSAKSLLANYFLDRIAEYGVDSSDPAAYVSQFYNISFLGREELVSYLISRGSLAGGFARNNAFNKNYLIFDALIRTAPSECYTPVFEIFGNSVTNKSYNEISFLLKSANAVNGGVAERLIKDAVERLVNPRTDINTLFYFIENITNSALQLYILKIIVDNNLSVPGFIKGYMDKYVANPSLYGALESELIRDRQYANLRTERETYTFRNSPNVTRDDLKNYFVNYYLRGLDNGLYYQKLEEHLRRNRADCFGIYEDINNSRLVSIDGQTARILYLLRAYMYAPSPEEIIKYDPRSRALLDDLDAKLARAGYDYDKKKHLVDIVTLLNDKRASGVVTEKLLNGTLYTPLDDEQVKHVFVNYFPRLLDLYAGWRSSQKDFKITAVAVNYLIVKPIENPLFDSCLANGLDKLGREKSLVFADLLFLAVCCNGAPARLKSFLKSYIANNRKQAEKLCLEAVNLLDKQDKENVKAFVQSCGAGREIEKQEKSAEKRLAKEQAKAEKGDADKPQRGFNIFGWGRKK